MASTAAWRGALVSRRGWLAGCAGARRALCGRAGRMGNAVTFLGAGAAGGTLGGLVGLGGGAIMVPLMTRFAGMSQHAAVGTSSAAVAMTGLCGWASFSSAGAVDLPAAFAVAATAMFGARFGAKLTSRYSSVQLGRIFAYYQLAVAPLVPLKSYIVRRKKEAEGGAAGGDGREGADQLERGGGGRARELALLSVMGVTAGVASGLFGIGGGMVVTPGLCLLTDLPYATVLGTTLASMIPPSLVSAFTHSQMGNLALAAALPLSIGSGIGAFGGGQIAVRVPEEPLQVFFTVFLAWMGASKLRSLHDK